MIEAVLFDFDGTLVDTRTASWVLFQETNAKFGLGVDTREQFIRLFESNMYEELARLCGDDARCAAVNEHFFGLIRTRYQPPLIAGVDTVVRRLAAERPLVIISSNIEDTLQRLLRDIGLADCFAHVFSGDNEPSKARAIESFLAGRWGGGRAPLAPEQVVLVTDTVGDVGEARASGIRALGVSWGMHGADKLLAAGASAVVHEPDDIFSWINDPRAAARSHEVSAAT